MAAELSVCDVLCEAMEYLSKLGSNLRTRSDSLKEKRISKDKLKNAHAVHKAANKVLLICELSKKSLDNVEAGVRKVLSIVDASQAHEDVGGKKNDKAKQQKTENFYYFEFETHKLRISKKIPLKHYMSAQVYAKGMPSSMMKKYPVFYDCKLKRRRTSHLSSTENKIISQTSLSKHDKDDNSVESSHKDGKKESTKGKESLESESNKSKHRKKSVSCEKSNMGENSPLVPDIDVNSENENGRNKENTITARLHNLDIQGEVSTVENKDQTDMNLEHKNQIEKNKAKEPIRVSDLIECFANEAKVDDGLTKNNTNTYDSENSKTNCDKNKGGGKEGIRKKFSKIRIADDSSESDAEHLKDNEKLVQKENITCKENSGLEKDLGSEPKSKKMKLTDDASQNEDSDNNSLNSRTSQSEQKNDNDHSKPVIRCVNITKLLDPNVLGTKTNNSSNVDTKKQKVNHNEVVLTFNEVQTKNSGHSKKARQRKNTIENGSDDEFWALKRSEVKKFQSKKFTVNIERLPQLSINFLITHNLKRILQGCNTICEVTKEHDKELDEVVKNIDDVKNALLNDSASDTDSTVRAEAHKVKNALLKDSDSEKEQTTQSTDTSQLAQEKLPDPAVIKDALLNESESENNEEQVTKEDASVTSNTKELEQEHTDKHKSALLNDSDSDEHTKALVTSNTKEIEQEHTDKHKSALLNDSDSDEHNKALVTSNTKEIEQGHTDKHKSALLNDSDSDEHDKSKEGDETVPTLERKNHEEESREQTSRDNDLSNNKEDNVCAAQSSTIDENEPVQDPEKIKSSLLNDSSDSKSSSSSSIVTKRKKFKHKRKHARKSMKAKKMLLHYSSSSESEKEHSQESHKAFKHKSKVKNPSSADEDEGHVQVDETIGEHSNNSKMVRSKAKPSGSSGQNSDNQDASDKDIDGLTNLNNLNKPHRRRDSASTNNTESRSSARNSRSKPPSAIGEDLLDAMTSSDASEDENVVEEDLPPVSLSGLNGGSIDHLAKDDLLGESDSSASHHKEQDEVEEIQNADSEEEEEKSLTLKRRKANTISSDSEGGTSRRKQNDEDVRVSDFEDSEDESTESGKRTKRKKKGSDSDASGTSSTDGGTKKRRRIKLLNDSDASGSDTENEGRNKHGRKNIRKVMGKNQLEEATKKAAREEKERIARITERQKLYNNLDFDESGKPDEVVLEKVVLDFDPETKEPLIEVDRGLVKKLKPHQANGIKFMWDACFESVKRIKKDKGSGCILAHCMGLGKTLQVISLTHTLLIHGSLTGVNRVLVVCPLSTVLNWVNEFKMWLKHAHSEFEVDVYELSRYKQNSERAFQLQQWFEGGGVCVLGYEMFRNLSADNNKKFKKKMLRSFQESLVDPGPDLVVCDEGHLLKNEKTSLSQSMNRVKTRRRIVLTGTPLQNNLKEYYCMVQFVKPNLLGKYNEYLNRFVNPITNGQYTDSTEHDIKVMKRRSHVLHKMLDGAVQRRDYGVLAPFLPPKHEYVLFITLSDVQVKLYQFYLDNYSRRPLPGKSSGFLFPDFQSLQRIWTHPLVLKYNSERYEIMQQKKREREEEDSEGSLVDFIDDDSTPEETSTEESSDDLSDISDDSRKKSKKKKSAKKSKAKDSKIGTRRGTRANPVEIDDDEDVAEVVEAKNENPTEWWIKLVEDEELDDMRNSHKLVLLFDILRQCETIGDKLLVFSQSLYSLDLIEHFLGKVDEATQEGRVDEKLGGHLGSWSPGVDYFRLDGSTSCENRSIWCKNFNREDNPRARLFLISTRAGGLGINLVAANRVVIFDVSWNPSHDVQSIFRVYRFGQKKPCYVYRFLAMGTMEEKIYERQVTKQAISKRVIDEQQIDRHYAENDLAELYKFEARPDEPRPLPTLPKDRLFAEMLKEHEAQIYKYHEHDSLLENKEEETLSEEERKAAWEDFENEKNKPPPAPFPSAWPMHNGMVPGLLAQQQQQLAYAALAAMLRKDMPNINDNQIRDMLPLIYNSNPGLMQKMSEIYKYAQPGMMNPGMMNPVMNPAASGGGASLGGASGLQYEPPWQRQHQQQQQMRLQQLMQQNQMGAKFYAGGLGSRDPVAMALQQQRAREIMMGGGAAGRARGRPPLAPRAPTSSADVVNLDSD